MSGTTERERLALLVHELRSPVAALAAIAGTFPDAGAETGRAELVRLAVLACRALERIAVDVVATSVRREPLDTERLVRDAAATARLHGGDVLWDVADGLPEVSGDPVRLKQALDNLVVNALVHSGTDAPVTIKAGAATGRDALVLSVTDSGIGIAQSELGRIFEAGERLRPERGGSGLGLALVRAIAEAHGGEATVTSAPGAGATFAIVLPAR